MRIGRSVVVSFVLIAVLLLLGTGACSKGGSSPTGPSAPSDPAMADDSLRLPLPSPKFYLTDLDTGEVTQYWVQFLDIRPNRRQATIYVPRGRGVSGCNESGSTCPQFSIVSSTASDLTSFTLYYLDSQGVRSTGIVNGYGSLNTIWNPGMGSWSFPIGNPDCCKGIEVVMGRYVAGTIHSLSAKYTPDVDYVGQLY